MNAGGAGPLLEWLVRTFASLQTATGWSVGWLNLLLAYLAYGLICLVPLTALRRVWRRSADGWLLLWPHTRRILRERWRRPREAFVLLRRLFGQTRVSPWAPALGFAHVLAWFVCIRSAIAPWTDQRGFVRAIGQARPNLAGHRLVAGFELGSDPVVIGCLAVATLFTVLALWGQVVTRRRRTLALSGRHLGGRHWGLRLVAFGTYFVGLWWVTDAMRVMPLFWVVYILSCLLIPAAVAARWMDRRRPRLQISPPDWVLGPVLPRVPPRRGSLHPTLGTSGAATGVRPDSQPAARSGMFSGAAAPRPATTRSGWPVPSPSRGTQSQPAPTRPYTAPLRSGSHLGSRASSAAPAVAPAIATSPAAESPASMDVRVSTAFAGNNAVTQTSPASTPASRQAEPAPATSTRAATSRFATIPQCFSRRPEAPPAAPTTWSSLSPAVTVLGPGEPHAIGKYRLLGRIGSGGMAIVYLASDTRNGQAVALKVVNPLTPLETQAQSRMMHEAAALGRIDDPGVVPVLDAGITDGHPFLVMAYLRGPSLDKAVAQHGALAPDAAWAFAKATARALAAVHTARVTHRDVKPGNLILTDAGPVLVDLGIANVGWANDLTAVGTVLGTMGYVAPEVQVGAPATATSDVWAWGACVAFAATGRRLFGQGQGRSVEEILNAVPDARTVDALRRVDPQLMALVLRAADRRPEARPRDGVDLVARVVTTAAWPAGPR